MPEIRVQLEEDHYVEAAQAAAKPRRRILVFFGVISLMVVAAAAMAWDKAVELDRSLSCFSPK